MITLCNWIYKKVAVDLSRLFMISHYHSVFPNMTKNVFLYNINNFT